MTCSGSEIIYAVWNTTAGGSSTPSTSGMDIGNYYPTEISSYACDNNASSVYTNFGACTSLSSSTTCGLNTDFYRTPARGASLMIGLQVCTGPNLSLRDPITITFEGSNQPISTLTFGSSWTLLYSGLSGLATDPGRQSCEHHSSFLATQFGTRAIDFSSLQSVVRTHPPGTPKFNLLAINDYLPEVFLLFLVSIQKKDHFELKISSLMSKFFNKNPLFLHHIFFSVILATHVDKRHLLWINLLLAREYSQMWKHFSVRIQCIV